MAWTNTGDVFSFLCLLMTRGRWKVSLDSALNPSSISVGAGPECYSVGAGLGLSFPPRIGLGYWSAFRARRSTFSQRTWHVIFPSTIWIRWQLGISFYYPRPKLIPEASLFSKYGKSSCLKLLTVSENYLCSTWNINLPFHVRFFSLPKIHNSKETTVITRLVAKFQ